MTDHLDGCEVVLAHHDTSDPNGDIALRRAAAASSSLQPRAGHDTGIADRLRDAGLNVVEVAGWRTRGSSSFAPRGSLDHHTAGPRVGNAPSLGICINGRSDLPGPLCHVLIGRDHTCYVVAAGRANHAGTGSWKGLSGNSTVFGIERENVGTTAEPWHPDQTAVAARAHAALIAPYGIDPEMVCGHREWTTRKPDAHSISYPAFRLAVAKALLGRPGLAPSDRAALEQATTDLNLTAAALS